MQGNRPRSARVHPPAAQSPPLTPWARAGAQGVSVRACPALAALRRPGEDVHALLDAPPVEGLLRGRAHPRPAAGPPWRAPPPPPPCDAGNAGIGSSLAMSVLGHPCALGCRWRRGRRRSGAASVALSGAAGAGQGRGPAVGRAPSRSLPHSALGASAC